MTGIAGIVTPDGAAPDDGRLSAMLDALARRGPDGRGRYVNEDAGLVQAHLAVSGAEEGGPYYNSVGGGALVGDMMAAAALAVPEIRARRGRDFAAELSGGYAVAVHDPRERELILARDRFGARPLYYAETPGGFAFASVPAVLVAAGFGEAHPTADSGADPARDTRDQLLQLQFVTGAETPWRHVRRVLPGETLVVRRGRVVDRRRLAVLPEGAPWAAGESEDAAVAELDRLLRRSMERRLADDPSWALFLGGGLDSAVLLYLAREAGAGPIHAFTAGFDDAGDMATAQSLARRLGVVHHEVRVTEADFRRHLPRIVAATDDPVADYGLLPTWKLAAAAAEFGAKVALSGEGADELFAGYGRHRSAVRPWWLGGRAMRHRGLLDGMGVLRDMPAGWRDGIVGAESTAASSPARTPLQVAQAVDVADWLPNDLLLKQDRCLGSHGMEARYPYLDGDLADFAYLLPDDFKIRRRVGKVLLRRWAADHLPVVDAFRRKRGLAVPVGRWMAAAGGRLGALVAGQPGVAEACLPDGVEKLFGRDDKRAVSAQWVLLYYALWHQIHIAGAAGNGGDGDIFETLAAAGES